MLAANTAGAAISSYCVQYATPNCMQCKQDIYRLETIAWKCDADHSPPRIGAETTCDLSGIVDMAPRQRASRAGLGEFTHGVWPARRSEQTEGLDNELG